MYAIPTAVIMLICSNVFMTFAWYAHLKTLYTKPWIIAALVSWGIALDFACSASRNSRLSRKSSPCRCLSLARFTTSRNR